MTDGLRSPSLKGSHHCQRTNVQPRVAIYDDSYCISLNCGREREWECLERTPKGGHRNSVDKSDDDQMLQILNALLILCLGIIGVPPSKLSLAYSKRAI